MLDKITLTLNVIICSAIFLRVASFKRNGKQRCKKGGWIAWLVLCYSSSVPVRAALEPSYHAGIDFLIANSLICAAVLLYRGNVMSFFKAG